VYSLISTTNKTTNLKTQQKKLKIVGKNTLITILKHRNRNVRIVTKRMFLFVYPIRNCKYVQAFNNGRLEIALNNLSINLANIIYASNNK